MANNVRIIMRAFKARTLPKPELTEITNERRVQETLRGSIPNFFMREISVVRLMPKRAAAP
jgi:hypothetical protein